MMPSMLDELNLRKLKVKSFAKHKTSEEGVCIFGILRKWRLATDVV